MQNLLYRLPKSTKRIWFEDLYMSLIYKRKSTGPITEPRGTPNVMFWHRGTAVFDWVMLFPVTQIRLKPVLHDTSNAIATTLKLVEKFDLPFSHLSIFGNIFSQGDGFDAMTGTSSKYIIPLPYFQQHGYFYSGSTVHCFRNHFVYICIVRLLIGICINKVL